MSTYDISIKFRIKDIKADSLSDAQEKAETMALMGLYTVEVSDPISQAHIDYNQSQETLKWSEEQVAEYLVDCRAYSEYDLREAEEKYGSIRSLMADEDWKHIAGFNNDAFICDDCLEEMELER